MEYGNVETMEFWVKKLIKSRLNMNDQIQVTHHSIIPRFHYSMHEG
jgi:hypothetical protein